MDLNVYSVEWLARERLADARARTAREAWLRSPRPPRQPWRVTLGLALIGLGRRIVGDRGYDQVSEAS
jgi:hypothetical protein